MEKIKTYLTILAFLPVLFVTAKAQNSLSSSRSRVIKGSPARCSLNGTYRVDPTASDKLYSVVKNATSSVPFGEQQQFFIDLSTRLTPPDMLAIECLGRQVSV